MFKLTKNKAGQDDVVLTNAGSVYIQPMIEYVKPFYATNDGGHQIGHMMDVLNSSGLICLKLGLSEWETKMAMCAACLHDIHADQRKTHHIDASEHVRTSEDPIFQMFENKDREIVAAACEEHRASYKGEYTSMVSQVVSSADRGRPNFDYTFKRSMTYAMDKEGKDEVEAYKHAVIHLKEKYGTGGYARYPDIYSQVYAADLKEMRAIVDDMNVIEISESASPIEKYLLTYKERLTERMFLIRAFTSTELPEFSLEMQKQIGTKYQEGDLVIKKGEIHYISSPLGHTTSLERVISTAAPIDIHEFITLRKFDISNVGKEIETTVGRFLLNYIVLVIPFGDKIAYVNDEWKIGKVEGEISRKITDNLITGEDYRKYLDNGYFIGHFGELAVPTMTPRSLTTDPKIKEVKKELLEKYKDQLNDPVVLASIEAKLLEMDADWLEGDDSEGFIDGCTKPARAVQRKKMFITVGGVEKFTESGGEYVFIDGALDDGLEAKHFPSTANTSRAASFSRGAETQKGGAQTKFVLRVFQDLIVVKDDCETKRFITVDGTKYDGESLVKAYYGRYKADGNIISAEDAGKQIKLRSPMTCEAEGGLCYKCAGKILADLDVKSVGMLANDITSTFLTMSLKKMHGTALSTVDIDPIKFIM